ncbi:MAG TPA: HdeD family acid-resistance protein [Chloroflexota bacterium]|nr:HdeD family acid-resistance protein [Chloroflexota bacterium]
MDAVVGTLSRNWWLLLLEGVVSVVLGAYALARPGITLVALIIVWGLFALINGVAEVFRALGGAHDGRRAWGWQLAGGLVGIVAGLAILRWPGISALFVLYLIGIWAIVTGIVSIVHAIADHEGMPHAWLIALGGIVSVLFGIVMFAWPGAGLLTLVYLVGIYAIVYGVITCVIAFRLHGLQGKATTTLVPPGPAPSY